ncbi:MAG: 23S rRNA (uracil(1939)-C(5))-methyltransferase RlmD [Lacibacter sp.]
MRKKQQPQILNNILVADYAAEGRSLARVNGKVVFIEGAVPGDVVDVLLTKNKKDWAEGKAVRIVTPAANRVEPFCEHFGLCGGCKWQMLPYEKQLQYKQREVEQNLRRIGHIDLPRLLPIAGADATRYYRNKLEFTFSTKRYRTREELEALDAGVQQPAPEPGALGFHVPRIFDKVIDIHTCYLMEEPANAIRNFIRRLAHEKGYPFYDIKAHTGWLRTLIIRRTTLDQLMVHLTFGYDDAPLRRELFDALLQAFPQITTLVYTINPKWNDSLHDLQPQVYHGPGYIIEQLEDYRFKIGPKSFFQTNTRQAEKLYAITRNFASLSGTEVLYDLYCGTGSIGLFCSRGARRVIGVEVVAEAIADARENARLNGVEHARFFAGDVVDVCTDAFFAEHGRPDVLITDPPRAGMHEKLVRKILEMEAPRVVYVSCNTATQARDLQLLSEKYIVERLQPVDLFPQTHHIENVAALTLRR